MERINFLKGIAIEQIEQKLQQAPPLTPGAKELMDFAKNQNIKTVIASGNIIPVLQYFQKLLGMDAVVGSPVRVKDSVIEGISEADYEHGHDFKLGGIKKFLKENNIAPENVLSIGDSIADLPVFSYVKHTIAINPKNGFEKHAEFVVKDFFEVIPIIQK